MDPDTAERRDQAKQEAPKGFIGLAGEGLSAARRFAGDVSELAALELRLAGTTAIRMLCSGLLVVIVASAAWILAQLALAYWLDSLDWPLAALLGVLAAINAITACLVVWYILALSKRLTFPATRRLFFEKAVENAHAEASDPDTTRQDCDGSRAA